MQTFDTVLKAAAAQVSLNVLLQCLRAICGRGGGMRCDGARTIHAALPACGALARNLVEQGEPGNHDVVTIMHIIIMIMIMIILIIIITIPITTTINVTRLTLILILKLILILILISTLHTSTILQTCER